MGSGWWMYIARRYCLVKIAQRASFSQTGIGGSSASEESYALHCEMCTYHVHSWRGGDMLVERDKPPFVFVCDALTQFLDQKPQQHIHVTHQASRPANLERTTVELTGTTSPPPPTRKHTPRVSVTPTAKTWREDEGKHARPPFFHRRSTHTHNNPKRTTPPPPPNLVFILGHDHDVGRESSATALPVYGCPA